MMIKLILVLLIGLALSAVNRSVGVGVGDWQFWGYSGIILAFSIVTDSRYNKGRFW